MAKQKGNIITQGLSGKIGNLLLFRQRNGQTIVSKLPDKKVKNLSEKQKKQQERFKEAIVYASVALKSPEIKDLYTNIAKKRKDISAYNVAIADFLHAPNIHNVNLSTYTGQVNSEINIIIDSFSVKDVHVGIYNENETILEEGYADNNKGTLWIYKTTQNNPNLINTKIIITACDLPGNITKKDISLNE
ncbi:MAG: hypothetical protein LBE13_17285 [Bacteroidales bacterium]|jgi:hypothetical protein|nr:hypothetical protein [Bacteroidales bacterium]